MSVNLANFKNILDRCQQSNAKLVAVSKIKPIADILHLYNASQRDFGENYVQELIDKQSRLPADIRWHFIGHLQSNKVKYIAPFVHLIHGVDSLKLLKEISKQGQKNSRVINCLLQVFIATEETKFGLDESELEEIIQAVHNHPGSFSHVHIRGLMGMGSFSDDLTLVRNEFKKLKALFDRRKESIPAKPWDILSMGMSGDYTIALEEGSTMIRVGSLLFGARL
ncbi:YggS family pyridoxal phosphate-dependent enzyme [Flavihumibacter sp. ZG627]|uniref:YggS family pyridoxal phosphate-dependent enzyme n=1 Tax=Flavihumibacter sp. ZG627 TaxID=1463156 RepID=UPI00057EA058|nr:YggS family pyridoxal phosphate-dependent enzyme [Flavihumibacter sp. ZG627]KIC90202.1 alanine racemase [Flavihumibacter sp. ZG627]